MTALLHPTRLEWDGSRGVARHDGVSIDLHRAPGGGVFHEIHYTPGCQAEVRERPGDARREMRADEVAQAQRLLHNWALLCREIAGQEP